MRAEGAREKNIRWWPYPLSECVAKQCCCWSFVLSGNSVEWMRKKFCPMFVLARYFVWKKRRTGDVFFLCIEYLSWDTMDKKGKKRNENEIGWIRLARAVAIITLSLNCDFYKTLITNIHCVCDDHWALT